MKIKITARSVMTQEGHFVDGQEPDCSEELKRHLVEIGSAIQMDYEAKVVEYAPVKKPQFTPSSPPAKASPKRTRKPRTKKPPQ
jgi:hypothetical protein